MQVGSNGTPNNDTETTTEINKQPKVLQYTDAQECCGILLFIGETCPDCQQVREE